MCVADDLVNRYTVFTVAVPKSSEPVESYMNTSKTQYAANVTNKNEDTRYAEPDPSLRPFFQYLLNSTKRKKPNLNIKSSDSRLVENFINFSINDLQNSVKPSDTILSVRVSSPQQPAHPPYAYSHESESQYLPVPVYTNVPKPKRPDSSPPSISVSGSVYPTPTTPSAYKHWQESPLIFPDNNKTPSNTGPPVVSSSSNSHYNDRPSPAYDNIPVLVNDQTPTFITPVQLQNAPTFITPIEYQGPTFVTPISVTQMWDGRPPPEIVILEDIDTESGPPQNDPVVVEHDPVAGVAGGVVSPATAAAATAAAGGAGAAAAAAAATAAGVAGAGAAAVVGLGVAGTSGGSGVAPGGGGALTPADQVQCRAGRSTSKICSELITTSSSPASSGSFLDGLISLFTSLYVFGPLTLTFWSMLFPPMSVILTSGIGVVSFLFPWLLPRIWFGRQIGQTFNINQFDQLFDNANDYHQPYYQ